MPKLTRNKLKPFIFGAIGLFNTAFDFTLYLLLLHLTHSIIIANVVSTSAALIGSYFLNSRLTFKSRQWTTANFASFVAVTLFGLWVLQTAAIYVFSNLLQHMPAHTWHIFGSLAPTAKVLLPKILATGITLVWNYMWYNKVIFREMPKSERSQIVHLHEEIL